jgi:hypothetical protein
MFAELSWLLYGASGVDGWMDGLDRQTFGLTTSDYFFIRLSPVIKAFVV